MDRYEKFFSESLYKYIVLILYWKNLTISVKGEEKCHAKNVDANKFTPYLVSPN